MPEPTTCDPPHMHLMTDGDETCWCGELADLQPGPTIFIEIVYRDA